MHIFTIRKDAYAKGWKRVLIPLICIDAMIVLAYLLAVNGSMNDVEGNWIIVLVFLTAVMVITAIRTARRQKKIYETFRLTISDNAIFREQHNTPAITIAKSEVREIRKLSNGVIAIVGQSKLNAIGIPAEIENREMLEQLLSDIRPLNVKNYGRAKGYLSLFITIAAVGLLWAGIK